MSQTSPSKCPWHRQVISRVSWDHYKHNSLSIPIFLDSISCLTEEIVHDEQSLLTWCFHGFSDLVNVREDNLNEKGRHVSSFAQWFGLWNISKPSGNTNLGCDRSVLPWYRTCIGSIQRSCKGCCYLSTPPAAMVQSPVGTSLIPVWSMLMIKLSGMSLSLDTLETSWGMFFFLPSGILHLTS